MAKTNFTKVEEILDEGLRKITVKNLLDLTDQAPKDGDNEKAKKASNAKQSKERLLLIRSVQRNLVQLQKAGKNPYEKFKITAAELKRYIDQPEAISSEEWEKVTQIKEEIEVLRKELETSESQKENEDLIEQQRRRHITKRFNINEKWLPLK